MFMKLEVLPPFHVAKYKTAIFMYNVFYDLVHTNILSHFNNIVCKSSYLCRSAELFKKMEVLPPFHLVKIQNSDIYVQSILWLRSY